MTFDSGFRRDPATPSPIMSRQQRRTPKSALSVLAIEMRCAISTLGLITRCKLRQPNDLGGFTNRVRRRVGLEDLSGNLHARLGDASSGDARRAVSSAAYRVESSWACPLPIRVSFQHLAVRSASRLSQQAMAHGWCDGPLPRIYEWEDEESATEYAETLRIVLAPWVQTGSLAYQIMSGVSRPDYLEGRLPYPVHEEDRWCSPARACVATHRLEGV